ncbi:hypothetical protein [Streptomyces sp. TLI_185]|uniref:hypothetical protein n=1 Tax=Streptomyces sp. TLI_185 TaxID=2485151 RepID=UPI000F4E6FC2|nr:hypothetical protein [Streptomyces sp. TLI_185]RPF39111.1 hypothetical protein EDD92_9304 [Streptomyces sp. TLI_185]
MSRKFAVITAIALSAFCGSAGVASADTNTVITGGDGFSSSTVTVNAPQQGLIISNGTPLVDLHCIGAGAPTSNYAACEKAPI